jgi:hypothetical protein
MHVRLASLRWLAVPLVALALMVSVTASTPSVNAQSQCIQTYYGTSFNCGTYYDYYTSMPVSVYGGPFGYATGYPWYASSSLYSLYSTVGTPYSYYPYSYSATMYPYSGYGYGGYGGGYGSYGYPYSYGYGSGYGYPYSSGYGYGYPYSYYSNPFPLQYYGYR